MGNPAKNADHACVLWSTVLKDPGFDLGEARKAVDEQNFGADACEACPSSRPMARPLNDQGTRGFDDGSEPS